MNPLQTLNEPSRNLMWEYVEIDFNFDAQGFTCVAAY